PTDTSTLPLHDALPIFAVMYHEKGIRQAQIADTLGLSQAKVSRLLKRAAQLGVVRTTVSVAPGLHTELEGELESTYGLAEAVIRSEEHTSELQSRFDIV